MESGTSQQTSCGSTCWSRQSHLRSGSKERTSGVPHLFLGHTPNNLRNSHKFPPLKGPQYLSVAPSWGPNLSICTFGRYHPCSNHSFHFFLSSLSRIQPYVAGCPVSESRGSKTLSCVFIVYSRRLGAESVHYAQTFLSPFNNTLEIRNFLYRLVQ
jgi:hypothetical protein